MSPQTKLALRRFAATVRLAARRLTIRWLRKLTDALDDRVHAAEVQLREDLAGERSAADGKLRVHRTRVCTQSIAGETYNQWEARRSGVAPVSKKTAARRRRMTAADFDRKYA